MWPLRFLHGLNLPLLAAHGVLAAPGMGPAAWLLWSCWLGYALAYLGARRGLHWCLRLCIVPPLLQFVLTAPWVLLNLGAFFGDDPLYLDSPGTILVVGLFGCCVTLPSALLLEAYWCYRRDVFFSRRHVDE
jgi:hypothetical protein